MRALKILGRSSRLRCPVCGRGRLFSHFFTMEKSCSHCGRVFEREPGFFLGSIYFNYGVTALVVTIAYPLLVSTRTLHSKTALAVTMAWTVLFPVLFFRHARSLWVGFDEFYDPLPPPADAKKIENP